MDESRKLFELNEIPMVNLTQYTTRMMKAAASVINFCSIAWRGVAAASVYSATRAVVVEFTPASAKELGPRGIRGNEIAPGFIATDRTRGLLADVHPRTLANITSRIGQAQDVANAALLGSDLCSYITGRVLAVSGGM